MIPLVRPRLPSMKAVMAYFDESLKSGQVSNFGPCHRKLVERLSSHFARFAVVTSTGTNAIRVAVQVSVKRGSRVLVPDYTHSGTLQAVVAAGMTPILCPVSRHTWTIDLKYLIRHCDAYDAFVAVSPFGFPVDFDQYDMLAEKLGKRVIYDLAGGYGMQVMTLNPVCFSAHATKNFSCGEGGFVLFSDRIAAEEARRLTNFGMCPDRSVSTDLADNMKPDDLKCAIMLAQLDREREVIDRALEKFDLIHKYQAALDGLIVPHSIHMGNSAPSLCVLSGLPAEELEAKGPNHGVQMKLYYPLLSEMPGLSQIARLGKSSVFFRTCLALPSDVTREEFSTVVSVVSALLSKRDARAHKK